MEAGCGQLIVQSRDLERLGPRRRPRGRLERAAAGPAGQDAAGVTGPRLLIGTVRTGVHAQAPAGPAQWRASAPPPGRSRPHHRRGRPVQGRRCRTAGRHRVRCARPARGASAGRGGGQQQAVGVGQGHGRGQQRVAAGAKPGRPDVAGLALAAVGQYLRRWKA